jgi:hypothetical protein
MTRRRKTLHKKKKRTYAPPTMDQLRREDTSVLRRRTLEATLDGLMHSNPVMATKFINGTLLGLDDEDPEAIELVKRGICMRLARHPLFQDLTLEQVETLAILLHEWEGTVGELVQAARAL